jgi:hypothetical protein
MRYLKLPILFDATDPYVYEQNEKLGIDTRLDPVEGFLYVRTDKIISFNESSYPDKTTIQIEGIPYMNIILMPIGEFIDYLGQDDKISIDTK